MKKALNYILEKHENGHFRIFSDSLSGLQALQNMYSKDIDVIKIFKIIPKLRERGIEVSFFWTPAHEGVPGNEKADEVAKEATKQTPKAHPSLRNLKDVKVYMKTKTITDWNDEWRKSERGREITWKIFPQVSTDLKYKTDQEGFLLRRALSGHFPTKAYLYRFNLRNENTCQFCENEAETIEHVLVTCPRFYSLRRSRRALAENFTRRKTVLSVSPCVRVSVSRLQPLALRFRP
jgi:hypothetical protein